MNEEAMADEVCQLNEINPEAVEAAQAGSLPRSSIDGLSRVFSAMADPTRIRILHALIVVEELCVCDIALITGLSVSAVSHQLRLLKDRFLVQARRDGRMVYYSMACPHVREFLETGLQHLEEL
jgi:DNA-binding transcriptional ArsR family regulator